MLFAFLHFSFENLFLGHPACPPFPPFSSSFLLSKKTFLDMMMMVLTLCLDTLPLCFAFFFETSSVDGDLLCIFFYTPPCPCCISSATHLSVFPGQTGHPSFHHLHSPPPHHLSPPHTCLTYRTCLPTHTPLFPLSPLLLPTSPTHPLPTSSTSPLYTPFHAYLPSLIFIYLFIFIFTFSLHICIWTDMNRHFG